MTLAERNNNPLNIRYTGAGWKGERKPYKGFCRFSSVVYGFRAAARIMYNYSRRGLKTLSEIIHAWAPVSDGNNPERYVKLVCAEVGLLPSCAPLSLDVYTFASVLVAMAHVEGYRRDENLHEKAVEGIKIAGVF